MGRPKKKGLSYFSFDVDIFEDDKIFDVQNEYGPLGEVIYIRLLCLIYKNGYYYRFESLDKLAAMLIKSIGNRWARDKQTVKEVILFLAKSNLFSSELMQKNVITSRSIQARYLKANERNLSTIEEYNLLENNSTQEDLITAPENQVSVTETQVYVTETPVNVSNNPLKESKGKESTAAAPPTTITRDFLIETYGMENVIDYEQRFDDWKSKKGGIVHVSKYTAISKWMQQDGVTKPVNKSSFSMKETMDRVKQRYRGDKSNNTI